MFARYFQLAAAVLWFLAVLFYFVVGGTLPGFAFLAGSASVYLIFFFRRK